MPATTISIIWAATRSSRARRPGCRWMWRSARHVTKRCTTWDIRIGISAAGHSCTAGGRLHLRSGRWELDGLARSGSKRTCTTRRIDHGSWCCFLISASACTSDRSSGLASGVHVLQQDADEHHQAHVLIVEKGAHAGGGLALADEPLLPQERSEER